MDSKRTTMRRVSDTRRSSSAGAEQRFGRESGATANISFKAPIKSTNLKASDPELYKELFAGREGRHTAMSEDGMFIYHLGIIDYLQDYNLEKRGEHWLKSFIADGALISAIPPAPYSLRYFQFMQS